MRLIYVLLILLIPVHVSAASENLDEMESRKSRIATSTWSKTNLEAATTYVWQPEILTYTDITTGQEVTKLNASIDIKNSLPDIGWPHYSADGKRFSFGSHRDTDACISTYETHVNQTYQGTVMMMRTDGMYLRPADNSPFEVFVNSRYLHWSPSEPDVYYGFGRDYAGEGLNTDDLYKVTVSDTSIEKTKILDLDTGVIAQLKKGITSDSITLATYSDDKYFIVTLNPSVSITDATGWSRFRQLDDYWGSTVSDTNYTLHDEHIAGMGSDTWIYFLPEGYFGWWRYALSGSDTDDGPLHVVDNTVPFSSWGGELEPVFTGHLSGGACDDADYYSPWNCDEDGATGPEQYLSHVNFDRWGTYAVGVNSQQYQAWGVWNLNTHAWFDANISAPHYDWHPNWAAWSDFFVASPSSVAHNDMIYLVKYDGTSTSTIVNAHIRESSSTDYNSLPRVTQSPDGTKVVFHSDFLNNTANNWDIFQAVAYYPYPAEVKTLTATGGTVTLEAHWNLAGTTRGYTNRGWPDESTDDPPPPREVSNFRLWRSADKVTWVPIKTFTHNVWDVYDFSDGTWNSGTEATNTWTTTDIPGDGTWYYSVTSIEHSKLESRSLSNIFSITVTGGTGTGSQDTTYPATPGSDSNFIATYNSNLHRYYNIYAEDGSTPTVSQVNLIASDPRTTKSFIDVFGNTNGTTQYTITAVDNQGNESAALSVEYTHNGSGKYTITWTDDIIPTATVQASGIIFKGIKIK